ncbi:MAG: hypothetical protein MZV64_23125 [Ignavibacteriales bacterium]|nr:hypothetical protein [Ignavibacteriales bacterium]
MGFHTFAFDLDKSPVRQLVEHHMHETSERLLRPRRSEVHTSSDIFRSRKVFDSPALQ